ncbi:MAG: dihydrolipoamide acetyltransferase family protein [Myxococcales bacterium]|jgi:pyruvate dehydrogenase E2 component (dihydrolipoamide acetyltransferase)
MATAIVMPKLSDTMTEGKILKWNKKEGDSIEAGDALADVETDKATLELEAYESGNLLKILVPEGSSAPVGATVAVSGEKGEDISSFVSEAPKAEAKPQPKEKPKEAAKPAEMPRHPVREIPRATPTPGRILASPLARRMARDSGVDLSAVKGSGPGGRIVARDIEEAVRRAPAAVPVPAPAVPLLLEMPARPAEATLDLTGMRRVIAERMSQSKREAPHFYLSVEVDMEAVEEVRRQLKGAGARVSVNDFMLKAAGFALLKVPEANRVFEGDHLRQLASVDVAMAVALPDGLISPVVRGIDRIGLLQVGAVARDLAERARSKRLKPEEYAGGSVTVSNLGMLGIDTFSAIINPPQPAILAVGTVAERPAVVDGKVVARKRAWVTLSGDHRVIDGAVGARYLGAVRDGLEHPLVLMA